MIIKEATKLFVSDVEKFAQKKFHFKPEIEYLLELSKENKLEQVFDELTFYAKFVSNAHNILNRTGMDGTDTVKLSDEYKLNLQRAYSLLSTLTEFAPDDVKNSFAKRIQIVSPDSVENLLSLMYELSWVKNYNLDKEKMVG
ncbi:MAG: hypothetical protein HY800_06760 [Ignavibacteriales bacterium]|nr:hypothetical protein [Ignavibacteriales bacterium]